MSDHFVSPTCLRCGHALIRADDSRAGIVFFECQACGRRYGQMDGQGLVFRWPHPIGVALYTFLFRSGPEEHHISTAVASLVEGRSLENVERVIREIELELDNPTQQVHQILDGLQASEMECRSFLRILVSRLKQGLEGR